jgi:hypothetical protein
MTVTNFVDMLLTRSAYISSNPATRPKQQHRALELFNSLSAAKRCKLSGIGSRLETYQSPRIQLADQAFGMTQRQFMDRKSTENLARNMNSARMAERRSWVLNRQPIEIVSGLCMDQRFIAWQSRLVEALYRLPVERISNF